MITKSRNLLIGVLLMIAMLLGVFAITPQMASAATINAVWWTNASDMTDFTASFASEWISSKDWYKLMKYDEARGFYAQVSDSSGYVGTNTKLDFEEVIRRSGNGKYKVAIETTSGTEYETAGKTYTFEGALDAPQNLRWFGEAVLWDPVEGADRYDITLRYKKNESSDQIWSKSFTYGNTCSVNFAGQLSYPGDYYVTVVASSTDEMLVSSSAKSPKKTVAYTYSELNAHFGNVNNDEKKYTLYWDESPDATGYYMVFSKKNGEEYQPVTGVDNKLSKVTKLDLYAVMEANGEGDYKAEFFAFSTSPTIPVSNDASVEITFTICEHSYTKEIQTSDYLHSGSISCTAKTEYYYACEHCGEAAPNEEQYIYEGAIGEHDLSAGYQADGKMHWLACAKCDYAEYQKHTLDANNYCAKCDTTVYNVWLGDIQITSKNCDDITGDGSAFYIPEQNRLFLTNYTDDRNNRKGIAVIDPDNGNDYVAMIYAKNGLNLYIRGENFLYEDEGDIGRQYAVYVESGDLKIDGTGSLYTNASTGFYTVDGDIYIDKSGGLLEVVARYAFRCAEHKFYISNGTVKARSYAGYVYTSAPVLDNYSCYYAEIADNYDMNNPTAFEPITNVKYFYIEPAYTVTIEPFECEGDYITEVLRYGAEYTLPACPYTAPAGKTFYKWGVTPPGNLYEAGVKITITENVELMPMWQAIAPDSLTATYSGTILAGNKLTPANISITLTYNDSSTQPVNAGDVEYWYGDVQITDPENYVFGTELIGDVNITVKYAGLETTMTVKVVGHEITFNANGGTGDMAKAEYVGEYTLPDCTFCAPTGKQFKGWATSADGDVIAATTYNVTENVELFAIWEDVATTPITSISVSGADLPEVGETADDMAFTPDSLTYGGEYIMVGRGMQKFDGTEWVNYVGEGDVVEEGVRYRISIVLAPKLGYDFTSVESVTVNGKAGVLEALIPTGSVNYAAICFEFSYEAAPATPITSISVSGADLPEVGKTAGDMAFTPDSLTYGGQYKMVGRGFEKYTGTEWVDYNSEGDIIEYGVKYRVSLVLAPNEGYAFADTITSDDVTFNGKAGEFDTLIAGVGYAAIYYEFSYEAPVTDYGITIADKDESGATVGVLITEENYTDVLGDGTVSYDPATNTLTLNGYKHEGSGFVYDGAKYGISVPKSIGTLTIVLKGENVIDLTKADTLARVFIPSVGVYIWETDVVIKGDGSLVISATGGGIYSFGEADPSIEIKSGNITVNAPWPIDTKNFKMIDGSLTINATEIDGDVASAIYSYEFKMTGGNLKITSDGLGIEMWHDSDEDAPPTISGGTFEISTKIAGGAICYYNYDEDVCVAIAPDLTNYVGAYKMTAGANADGTSAVDYSASDIATYKFAKLESVHVHDYGTAWESDENNHWNECECGDKANVAPHADENNDGKCDTCDYAMGNADNPGGDKESEKTGLSGGAIAGIAVGSVAVAGLGGFSLFWFVIKKKKFADLIALFKKK